jgi:hypothetical protein
VQETSPVAFGADSTSRAGEPSRAGGLLVAHSLATACRELTPAYDGLR